MTLPPLLRPSYWFDLQPTPLMPMVERSLLVLFGVLFVAGILGRLILLRSGWDKLLKRAVARASSALLVLGSVGLLLSWFSYERLYVLSIRFGYLLWLVLFGWYVWRLYILVYVEMPEQERVRREREEHHKWLPKSRR